MICCRAALSMQHKPWMRPLVCCRLSAANECLPAVWDTATSWWCRCHPLIMRCPLLQPAQQWSFTTLTHLAPCCLVNQGIKLESLKHIWHRQHKGDCAWRKQAIGYVARELPRFGLCLIVRGAAIHLHKEKPQGRCMLHANHTKQHTCKAQQFWDGRHSCQTS